MALQLSLPLHEHPVPIRGRERYIVEATGCWRWTGTIDAKGYGRLWVRRHHQVMAHRVVYEELVGPIPPGLELDHLCRNPVCVNPAHLEPVTHQENMRRGFWGAKTICVNGHPLNETNVYLYRGRRCCRPCQGVRRRVRLGRAAAA